jgi:hypothetical protein
MSITRSESTHAMNHITKKMTGPTKQSILSFRGEMDCFAEPVIGRAFARPVGSQ